MVYLYHYTSLDTLALILHNRTFCFNNLLYVDDIEEAETSDMGKFGRFVYVSCWTDDKEESIPLWNMYTPNPDKPEKILQFLHISSTIKKNVGGCVHVTYR